jgi:hypothetical protein
MTVMPEHAVRLLETSNLLVLDPTSGPQSKSVATLTLGDEILVQAGGRMCFRRLLSVSEAPPPALVTVLLPGTLASGAPRVSIAVDSRQPVGLPLAQAILESAGNLAAAGPKQDGEYWMDVLVEGAARIIVENLSIGTGPLPAASGEPVPGKQSDVATKPASPLKASVPAAAPSVSIEATAQGPAETVAPLKAFAGQHELPLVSPVVADTRMVLRFTLPPRTTTLRLISSSAQSPGDARKLGVAIFGLSIEGSEIPLDSPALVRGFHRAETGEGLTWRWTDGEALLIMQPKPLPQLLTVHVTDWHKLLRAEQ